MGPASDLLAIACQVPESAHLFACCCALQGRRVTSHPHLNLSMQQLQPRFQLASRVPNGIYFTDLHLNKVRGVAAFVKYGDLDLVEDPDIGTAFPEGMIATNCQPVREMNIAPFSICHAALFSSVERMRN